ncbi:hypothetical protein BV25DRAFT_1820777 [Artomyces pyxidatus]|uniref:Uncharacterized protein n=1 Tax=Artomyces pyxidatus TaxID=48021 RepID=A0ACB8TE74_9AGAM|nr:hypothetical protein BV25DRAFT_1820777 [Artomyces pyxidatus]
MCLGRSLSLFLRMIQAPQLSSGISHRSVRRFSPYPWMPQVAVSFRPSGGLGIDMRHSRSRYVTQGQCAVKPWMAPSRRPARHRPMIAMFVSSTEYKNYTLDHPH